MEELALLAEGGAKSDALPTADEGGADGLHTKRGCCDCTPVAGWRKSLGELVTSEPFGNVSTGLVLVNLALMCMPYTGMSEGYAAGLENAATVITVIFMVEMVLKLLGLGCAQYWADGWNKVWRARRATRKSPRRRSAHEISHAPHARSLTLPTRAPTHSQAGDVRSLAERARRAEGRARPPVASRPCPHAPCARPRRAHSSMARSCCCRASTLGCRSPPPWG